MPVDAEDRYFGASKGSANKALRGLVAHYGYTKGHEVFNKILAERRKAGKRYGRAADRG